MNVRARLWTGVCLLPEHRTTLGVSLHPSVAVRSLGKNGVVGPTVEEERFVFISEVTEQVSAEVRPCGRRAVKIEGLTRSTREFHLARKQRVKSNRERRRIGGVPAEDRVSRGRGEWVYAYPPWITVSTSGFHIFRYSRNRSSGSAQTCWYYWPPRDVRYVRAQPRQKKKKRQSLFLSLI